MMRITGLASGIDTESIVKQLMEAHRIPQTKLVQQKQILEWQRDDYRTVNSKILEFRNLMFDMTLSATYNKKSVTISNDSAFSATAVGNAPEGSYSIKVKQLARAASLISNELDVKDNVILDRNTQLKDLNGFINGTNFTVNGIDIEITEENTISDFVSSINAVKSETGVSVSFDESLGRLFFTTDATGQDASIKLGSENANFLKALGLTELETKEVVKQGENAVVEFNGTELEFSSNSFTINGIQIQAKAVQDTEVFVTVNHDAEAIFNQVKKFVDTYNEMIELINGELSERRFRNFPPLTEEQKKEMTEREIELWEERARSGMLRGDHLLSSALDSFRRALSSQVEGLPEGAISHLSEIGIKTGAWTEKGKLHIDEQKLRDAIAKNPDEVAALFRAKDGDTKGIAVQLVEQADRVIRSIVDKAGREGSVNTQYELGKRIDDVDDRLSNMERKLIDLENRYYHQFTVMEKYISQMNSQSMWLMQFFGGM